MEPLPRRTVLHGMGTALALPFLEAMLPRGASHAPRPTRLAYVYVPNGIHMQDWLPSAGREPVVERLGALPWILEPLAPWRDELSVLGGLTHDKGRANGDGPGDHARAAATWLTGVQPLKTDGQVELGISADQVVAQAIGHRTRFRSLELGSEAGRTSGQCDSGYACAYSGHISWQGPRTPSAKETDPRALFDRLFRGGLDAATFGARREHAEQRRSVLDFVRADARRLERRLVAEDRDKLDEYFSGVRELERRLDVEDSAVDVDDELRPAVRPDGLAQRVRLLADVLVLAFRTDATRIATLMIANEGSNRPYRDLDISDGHHTLSHHGGDAAKHEKIRTINRHHVELFTHLVGGLSEAREGGVPLLDACMVVYGAGLGDGNSHAHHDLPTLLVGRGNGSVHPGRFRRFPHETPMNDLHLALLERMGVTETTLGDSSGVLEGL